MMQEVQGTHALLKWSWKSNRVPDLAEVALNTHVQASDSVLHLGTYKYYRFVSFCLISS